MRDTGAFEQLQYFGGLAVRMDEPDEKAFAGRGRFAMRPSDRRRQDRDVKQAPSA